MRLFNIVFILLITALVSGQEEFKSIHQEESEYYKNYIPEKNINHTSVNLSPNHQEKDNCQLEKRVFGYHPYWSGSKYLNYQWDKLSDLCYFSYEVNPSTGEADDLHNFMTSAAVDSALANDVKVHLCITLFSGHSTFFGSASAQQTLIDNCINLLQERGAQGINLDFEAVPSSLGDEYTSFTASLDAQLSTALPEAELSMATYAVNWSNTYDVPELNNYLDFFMVMSYDYYWNGSSYAGPIGSFYSMTSSFDYNFSKTISYYESQGVASENILCGIPYYGRTWKTQGAIAPSPTLGNANAKTYTYYKDNVSGNFSEENKKWEANSFAPYFSYQIGSSWYQAFIDNPYSFGKRYDIVNRRNLGGIGIWALGYDNGYTDLWDLIGDKFTTCADTVLQDTIFDSGGPAFDHYNKENYQYLITLPQEEIVLLRFDEFFLEENYDSLWIYDGNSVEDPLLAALSGNSFPAELQASSNEMLLKFYSDNATTELGWKLHYLPLSMDTKEEKTNKSILVYPNPSHSRVFSPSFEGANIEILSLDGSVLKQWDHYTSNSISLEDLASGNYFIKVLSDNKLFYQKIIIQK